MSVKRQGPTADTAGGPLQFPGAQAFVVIWDGIINTRHERKADTILEKKRVLPSEKRLQEELAKIEETHFVTPVNQSVNWSVMRR